MQQLTIGILVPHVVGAFASAIIRGAHQVAQRGGHRTIAFQLAPGEVARAQVAHAVVDGWIVTTMSEDLPELARGGRPLVSVCGSPPAGLCARVMPENSASTRAAIEHLIGHGHRRIAYLGFLENADHRERLESYRATLRAHAIEPDPALTHDLRGYMHFDGATAVAALNASGAPYTAIFVSHDLAAYGVLQALAEAGLRVPADVAVVSFDDMPASRFTDPPLTSIRQRAESLGEMAAEQLLAQIGGAPASADTLYAPTALIVRESCGCRAGRVVAEGLAAAGPWRAELSELLLQALHFPMPYDGRPAEQGWPGVGALLDGIEAAAAGAPSVPRLRATWQAAAQINPDLQVFYQICALVERAVQRLLDERGADAAARAGAAEFCEHVQYEAVRALNAISSARLSYYWRLLEAETVVMQRLLDSSAVDLHDLSWIAPTGTEWAVLGLWDPDAEQPTLRVVGSYVRGGPQQISRRSIPASEFLGAGHIPPGLAAASPYLRVVPVRTSSHDWGLIGYSIAAIDADYDGAIVWATLIGLTLERDKLTQSLTERQLVLEEAYERERGLALDLAQALARLRTTQAQLVHADKMAALGNLVAGVAHELRNPLNFVNNLAQLSGGLLGELRALVAECSPQLSERQRAEFAELAELLARNASEIAASGQRAETIISTMLLHTRSDSGAWRSISLGRLVDQAVGLAFHSALARRPELQSLAISVQIDQQLPTIAGAPQRLSQALINLIDNACYALAERVRAEPGHHPALSVRVAQRGDAVEIRIWDNGPGIPAELRSRVFEPFMTTKPPGDGTGLGLSLAYDIIVHGHAGSLTVASEPGAYCEFTVRLPLTPHAAEQPAWQLDPAP